MAASRGQTSEGPPLQAVEYGVSPGRGEIKGDEGRGNTKMRICITQTELRQPEDIWLYFHDFAMKRDFEYSPVQIAAVLCFRYGQIMLESESHAGYFDYCKECECNDEDELKQALADIGAEEFAENFIAAVENGAQENYDITDRWFFENSAHLFEAIEKYWQSHFDDFFEIVDENYTMLPAGKTFGAGIICTVFFFAFMVISGFAAFLDNSLNPLVALFLFFAFSPFIALGLFVVFYAKLWSVSVEKDKITARLPFRKPRTARFDEISNIRQIQQGFIIYVNDKKFVVIRHDVSGFSMFLAQLYVNGKSPEQQKIFAVRKKKALTIFVGVFCALFCSCAFLAFFPWQDSFSNTPERVLFFVAALWSVLYLAHCLQWRITVSKDSISIRDLFRREKEYLISEISKVSLDDDKMSIFIHDKKAAKIPIISEGYHVFATRLRDKNIPFYRNGKLL